MATQPGMPGRVEATLAALTLEEKASLTAGADMWSLPGVPRLGVPRLRVTDGPNGARGTGLLGAGPVTAACLPSGSALGATWDPALVEEVGRVLGQEARTKQCRVLLAPTVNLHRSPLGGRNFECFSEDPLLSGRIAAGFVRGVQSEGVACTPKHFVANDAEFERNTIDSVVDERTLRELYLVPFELAVTEGDALGLMSAYNRLNGTWCGEHRGLLRELLKDEWGFEGLVVTDWFAVTSTEGSGAAGLDVEMPGPGRAFGENLAEAVAAGRVEAAELDDKVRRILTVIDRTGAWDDPDDAPEEAVDRPEHRAVARRAAAAGTVLLRNDGVLPLEPRLLRRIAVIGPNAERPQLMGGGSAALSPHRRTVLLDELRDRLGADVEVVFEPGCRIDRTTPPVPQSLVTTPGGEPGFLVELFAGLDLGGEPVRASTNDDGRILYFGAPAPGLDEEAFSFRATARLTPSETGGHVLSLVQAGRARVLVDGALVLDGTVDAPPPGTEFFGLGSAPVEATVPLVAGRPVEVVVEYSARESLLLRGVKVGLRPPERPDGIERAAAAAAAADVAVVVVGTNDDWESEGADREAMGLPGRQDELVRAVCAANPLTVVVVNAGAPVTMAWAEEPAAILDVWFPGQEVGPALVDVLLGEAEPAGRLPTTFPLQLEHNPSYGNFPGENGEVRYGEGLLVGYRWYTTRSLPVRFPFGHGLSYTTFAIGEPEPVADTPEPAADTLPAAGTVTVEVPVTNTGRRRGAEVVQAYVAPVGTTRLTRPDRELKAFAKVWLDPGESTTARLALDERAFAYWDPGDPTRPARAARVGAAAVVPSGGGHAPREQPGWYVDAGLYQVRIGRSATDILHTVTITVDGCRRLETATGTP